MRKIIFLCTFLCAVSANATTKVGVCFNQYDPIENFTEPVDVMFVQSNNSPPIDWLKLKKIIKAKTVILNAEGIDRNQLLTGWGDPSKATILREKENYKGKADASFVYYEFPVYTLTPEDTDIAYDKLRMPIFLLYRTFDKQSINTTMLSKPKMKVIGGFFEFAPDMALVKKQNIGKFIDYLVSKDRIPYLLIPPGEEGAYVKRVTNALLFIRNQSKHFDKVTVLFAVYNRNQTKIDFKRVASAVRVFKGNFQ